MSADKVETILSERGHAYGDFTDNARVVQSFMVVAASGLSWKHLNDMHREALHMIFHKIGRIVNGDPDIQDTWDDIAGYAQLVSDRIPRQKQPPEEIEPL